MRDQSKQTVDLEAGTIREVGWWTLSEDQETPTEGVVTLSLEDDNQLSISFGGISLFVPYERIELLFQ